MTTATRLHQQGLQQGHLNGKLEERKEKNYFFIKNGFQEGLSIQLLAKLTGLSIEEVNKILKEIKKELA